MRHRHRPTKATLRAITVLAIAPTLAIACGARTGFPTESELDDGVAVLDDGGRAAADVQRDVDQDVSRDVNRDVTKDPDPVLICSARDAGPGTGGACTREFIVRELSRSAPGCFVDTGFDVGTRGRILFSCNESSPASVIVGGHAFEGVVESGALDVCTATEFPWEDGCTWRSAQRFTSSSVRPGATVDFSYTEAPLPNQKGCFRPCTAKGQAIIIGVR